MKSKSGKEIEIYDVEVPECLTISWDSNIGWGELIIYKQDGKIKADSESMSSNENKEFIKLVFNKLIEKLDVTD